MVVFLSWLKTGLAIGQKQRKALRLTVAMVSRVWVNFLSFMGILHGGEATWRSNDRARSNGRRTRACRRRLHVGDRERRSESDLAHTVVGEVERDEDDRFVVMFADFG